MRRPGEDELIVSCVQSHASRVMPMPASGMDKRLGLMTTAATRGEDFAGPSARSAVRCGSPAKKASV